MKLALLLLAACGADSPLATHCRTKPCGPGGVPLMCSTNFDGGAFPECVDGYLGDGVWTIPCEEQGRHLTARCAL